MLWLSQKLNMKTLWPREIINQYRMENVSNSGRKTSEEKLPIYNFWKESAVQSVDRRNDRDSVRLAKKDYLKNYKHVLDIEDENLSEEKKVFHKTSNQKVYVKASRMVYTKSTRKLYEMYKCKMNSHITFSTFYKYKPSYVKPPTEREKESCLCIRCLNIHLLLDGINIYRFHNGLAKHTHQLHC